MVLEVNATGTADRKENKPRSKERDSNNQAQNRIG